LTLRKVKGERPQECLKIGYVIDRKGIPRSGKEHSCANGEEKPAWAARF